MEPAPGQASVSLDHLRAEREQIVRQIDRLVDALADSAPAERDNQRLRELESRRLDLESRLATATAPAPRLHPNLAQAYRRKVEELQRAFAGENAEPARQIVRGLVEAIVLTPQDGRLAIEIRGELAAILRLSGSANAKAPAGEPELLVEQIKMVAGAGFEPAAFRL